MRPAMLVALLMLSCLLAAGVLAGCGGGDTPVPVGPDKASSWVNEQAGNVLHVHYGSGTDYPEYAALHLDSGYLRLVPTPASGWGTSVVTMPSLWTAGGYLQGAPITLGQRTVVNGNLLIPFSGTIGGLTVHGTIRLWPPADGKLKAVVKVTTSGSATLAPGHAGERFKPLMLSSMHESPTMWDARSAGIGGKTYPLPPSGWIVQPPVSGTTFSLRGGTSSWKANAPTIAITMPQARTITGWVTTSADPNDDNVAFWAATNTVLPSWQYTIVSKL